MNSLFRTELLLETQALFFSPNMQDFQSGISEVITSFQDTVLSVENLVPDIYFDAFTRSVVHEFLASQNEKPSIYFISMLRGFAPESSSMANSSRDSWSSDWSTCQMRWLSCARSSLMPISLRTLSIHPAYMDTWRQAVGGER